MKAKETTVADYLESLPEDRKKAMNDIRVAIAKNLPKGFEEGMQYGMIGFFVPHSLYPKGYHCKPAEPLPFISLASQKNFIAIYHMGIYATPDLMDWFLSAYEQANIGKPDMGKSCIRFKKMDKIPFDLIGTLASKMTPAEWIDTYEKLYVK
jgi:uncharacterized protein YdhG (YjbR/CyaY superfamily)